MKIILYLCILSIPLTVYVMLLISLQGGRELNDFVEYIAKQATDELIGYTRAGSPKKSEL